jgi:hypothetical protein
MIIFVQSCLEDETAIMVQAVCADRVFRVRYSMAVKKANNNKAVLKFIDVAKNALLRRMARKTASGTTR